MNIGSRVLLNENLNQNNSFKTDIIAMFINIITADKYNMLHEHPLHINNM